MKRRRGELIVLAVAAVFVAILAVSFRPGGRPAAGGGPRVPDGFAPDAAGQATTLLEGFDFTESVGGKPMMRIKADRTIGYGPAAGLPPNLYSGEKVTLTVYPDDGKPVTVLSDKADYDERTRQSRLRGNVRWTDKDGAVAQTEEVLFHPASRALDAPGIVHFTQGTSVLTAPSAHYDLAQRVLRFPGPVTGESTGAESGGLQKLTARSGLFRRDDGVLELEFPDGQSRKGDRLAADHLELKTGASGGHPEWAKATGNVRGIIGSDAEGAGGKPAPERQYAGDEGTVAFDDSGKAKTMTITGSPAVLWETDQKLRARSIEIGFNAGKASSAHAEGDVHVETSTSTATARKGRLAFGPDGGARDVTLEGDVRMDADGRHAEAVKAVETGPQGEGSWRLTGDASAGARVDSGGSRLSADAIRLDRAANHVSGEGRARAVFTPDAQHKSPTVTFVGDSKKPTYGKADTIVLDDEKKLATLTGSASLWQENSSLFADDIKLSDLDKTVTATGSVRSLLVPVRDKTSAKPGDKDIAVITSKNLLYRDSDRSARFDGGVAMTRGGTRTSGAEATAWLNQDGAVESVEISGDVHLADRATGRTGEAQKTLDYPRQGKTILWGAPARVTEANGNRVAGAILTIVDRGGSVEITAPEGGKTETIHRTQKN